MKYTTHAGISTHSARVDVEDIPGGRVIVMTDIVLGGNPVEGHVTITFSKDAEPKINIPPDISQDDPGFAELLMETRAEVGALDERNRKEARIKHAENRHGRKMSDMDRREAMRDALHDVSMLNTMSDIQAVECLFSRGIMISEIDLSGDPASYPPGSLGDVLARKTGRTTVLMAFSLMVEFRDIVLPEMISSGKESPDQARQTRKNLDDNIRAIMRHAENISYVEHDPGRFGVGELDKMQNQIHEIEEGEVREMTERLKIAPEMAAAVHMYVHSPQEFKEEMDRRIANGSISKQGVKRVMQIVRDTAEPEIRGFVSRKLAEIGDGISP